MQVLIGQLRDAAAARRACQKTNLQKIRFIDILDCYSLFTDCRRKCFKSDRPSAVSFYKPTVVIGKGRRSFSQWR